MGDATYKRKRSQILLTVNSAVSVNELWQLPNGMAGYLFGSQGTSSGERSTFETDGQVICPKTTGICLLDGGPVFWDHSANMAHYKKVNDRDFFIGTAIGDAASGDNTCTVNLNVASRYNIDLAQDPYITIPVGTQALGGFLPPAREGGAIAFKLTATPEAQKVDARSVDGFALGANAIIEGAFRLPNGGSGSASDFSIGIANATHATDADAITDSAFIHLNGNDLNIYAECDDGTNETNATDTTVDLTTGTAITNRVEFWIDTRDPASLKFYVNGSRVLSGTTFNISASTATWYLLAHLEKTTGTETADMTIDWLRARTAQQ